MTLDARVRFPSVTPKCFYSPLAQLVERLTVNQNVPGSSPGRGAKFLEGWPSGLRQHGANVSGSKQAPRVRISYLPPLFHVCLSDRLGSSLQNCLGGFDSRSTLQYPMWLI